MSSKTSKTQDSKKRKLPQTTLQSFFSQSSEKGTKKLHKNEDINKEDELIEINTYSISDQNMLSKSTKEEEKVSSKDDKNELKELLEFKTEDYKTIEDYEQLFTKISDLLMNKYLLTINYNYHYRISEIEFYFNDHGSGVHNDTFTHGDEMQKLAAKWYFHRFGKTYKCGTYKGMDLTFGKGDKAFGGILIRAISSVGATEGKHLPPNEFIEGPCNSVNKILEHNSDSKTQLKEVKDFVEIKGFSTDAFDTSSRLFLTKLDEKAVKEFKLDKKPLYRCPRVGLTLKKFDQQKCQFWLADYRFIIYPEKHKKMKEFLVMNLIKLGKSIDEIVKITKCQKSTAENLKKEYDKGQKEDKKKIADFKDIENVKGADFAYAYGIHYKKNK